MFMTSHPVSDVLVLLLNQKSVPLTYELCYYASASTLIQCPVVISLFSSFFFPRTIILKIQSAEMAFEEPDLKYYCRYVGVCYTTLRKHNGYFFKRSDEKEAR